MWSSRTKPKSEKSSSDNCRKKVVIANEKSKSGTEILSHPLRESASVNTAVRNVNSSLNPNKPQPISLQKNTLLKIEKKIRDTENAKFKGIRDPSELSKASQITFEEKITKHMNYPIEKKIYKQLISLNLTEKQPTLTTPTSFGPTVKDREPKLENYFYPKCSPSRPIPVSINFAPHSSTRTYNAFRTHQVMATWKK